MKTTFFTWVALTIAIMAVAPAAAPAMNATMKAIVVHHYVGPQRL